ncbi:MAG: hypothetical protein COU08_02195 [Candidatus Harrisonbacteria bacterium CG10_big_fil_rev_8_21_14_0_10_42_17]|uniref:Uncharacterized protein n=1 Tax=Candidatus Harrisonbacteria bacterium CG10_big_fil_rev_8_21_14_0_10_42_17 TaxID=1974584 RepID=A0A2M6WI82_9BACT|nr:MAG: hypothetical protein COU08_02195 [Candidatus Harrisonbacteria bacterium CG10_big_fil_rev_8_21_14_0_10_42_17]
MINFDLTTIDWTAIASISAVGIAVFSYFQSKSFEEKSKTREAIEKLLTPIRKELHSFSKSKWDNWQIGNFWSSLENQRLDFPLQYSWLEKANSQLVDCIGDFTWLFKNFDNLKRNTPIHQTLEQSIIKSVKDFGKEKEVQITGNAGNWPSDKDILNAHWSYLFHDPAVTLFSLVMLSASFTDYLTDNKRNEQGFKSPEDCSFSMSDLEFFPQFDETFSNELLACIEEDLNKHDKCIEIQNYRLRWQELYKEGNLLLAAIDSWIKTQ